MLNDVVRLPSGRILCLARFASIKVKGRSHVLLRINPLDEIPFAVWGDDGRALAAWLNSHWAILRLEAPTAIPPALPNVNIIDADVA